MSAMMGAMTSNLMLILIVLLCEWRLAIKNFGYAYDNKLLELNLGDVKKSSW